MKKVLLLSTVHPARDPRIIYKVAPVLAGKYRVTCALPGAPEPFGPLIQVQSLPVHKYLFSRILVTFPAVLRMYWRLRPHTVHIFVPELIPLAMLFRWLGSTIVYEVQENYFKKFAIKKFNRAWIYRRAFRYFDQAARSRFHLIFTDDAYLEAYQNLTYTPAIVHNYPALPQIDQWKNGSVPGSFPQFVYAGVISMERSLDVLIRALEKIKMHYPDFTMHFFGPLRVNESVVRQLPGYEAVCNNLLFYGFTDQQVWMKVAAQAVAGIALLKPVADYPESYTTKMFEYMAMGIPVVTSDFPLYRNVVERSECGFCIFPYDADALAEKLLELIRDPEKRALMGRNGRKAVEENYNWKAEQQTLLSFYEHLD
ncbi:glycosyltransferase [Dyadobacter sandarakinus]|uniref:Glycosyltransferase n=1 Tax=Dyadobacter sandarakinus TaxID=2747268 RepID=A0ABX7I9A4_9BACT|nr:glycosyltransferase [Dyadobacter sandarakinus]QRR02689.1 glycosyltransferase [Dyadobacter sandarakinus]